MSFLHNFSKVIHLAAQAGVRHSIDNPDSYFQSNLIGFGNILEAVRNKKLKTLFLLQVVLMEEIKKFHFLRIIMLIIH